MGLVMQFICLVLILCSIASALFIQGSAEESISPSPSTFPSTPSTGSFSHPPLALPPLKSELGPGVIKGQSPSLPPSTPSVLPPTPLAVFPPLTSNAPPPITFQVPPSLPPITLPRNPPQAKNPAVAPQAPEPTGPPSIKSPQNAPIVHPPMPENKAPPPVQSEPIIHPPIPGNKAPPPAQSAPIIHPPMPPPPLQSTVPIIHPPMPVNKPPPSVQNVPPPREMLQSPPPVHPVAPEVSPPSILPLPVSPPPRNSHPNQPKFPKVPSPNSPEPDISPVSAPPPRINIETGPTPTSSPTKSTPKAISPAKPPPPPVHTAPQQSNNAPPPRPITKSRNKKFHPPSSLPSSSFNRHQNATKNITGPAPLYTLPPPPPSPSTQQGSLKPPAPLYPPILNPNRHHMPPPIYTDHSVFPGPTPSPSSHPIPITVPFPFPKISPPLSSPSIPKMPLLTPFHSLPPPPPNEDCTSVTCTEPLTNTPPGSPCGCVWPMQVELRLSVALYTFFPLVSELANEIAIGVFMRQNQVRIMGANAASQDPEKTICLIDLVPLGERIDNTTAFLIFQRFWNKQVLINRSFFGDYEVLYVRYPGLPPSPPSAPSSVNIIGSDPYTGNDGNGVTRKPLGVDVSKKRHKNGVSRSVTAIIVLSASIAVILCCAIAWVFFFKHKYHVSQPDQPPPDTVPYIPKLSGAPASMIGSGPSSVSLSFGSSMAPYTGSAKTYGSSDIERATDNFNNSRIIGEGGFGRVYSGVLDDSTKVAVKVLKRDDQQGGREFMAEVEMLSRLHHRNLVKLIGICTEERSRCLVYELIPNGSVESHLHGMDRDNAPLDWVNRMKIALGAARALAYLHEDSSPRVIHRDFKSSNILLEDDFTPKVSDFGLARTAFDEENKHISTRVMGTFGYVAPEYAMTGHLLVKSDVYSYGVVLLELLTGRKPVDMSQPPGQENLVAWARPYLGTREGLESIIDPSIGLDLRIDSIAKVAAIASMCVQPEVSHRPFMGEVVQALKLVCNECDDDMANKDLGLRTCSQENLTVDFDRQVGLPAPTQTRSPISDYGSPLDVEMGISFRRHSSSGNLVFPRSLPLWQRMRRLSGGSMSEHGVFHRLWPGSQHYS